MYRGQGCTQPGVLHTHFNGQGFALGDAQAGKLGQPVTQQQAQAVVQDDDGEDQQAGGGDAGLVGGDHGGHNGNDGNDRDQGKRIYAAFNLVAQQRLGDQSLNDGQEDRKSTRLNSSHEFAFRMTSYVGNKKQRTN